MRSVYSPSVRCDVLRLLAVFGLAAGLAGCGGVAGQGPAAEAAASGSALEAPTAPSGRLRAEASAIADVAQAEASAPAPAGAAVASQAPVAEQPSKGGDVDACALASEADATALLGVAAGPGQPSSEGTWICMWSSTGDHRSVTLMIWTTPRLRQEQAATNAAAYYSSASTMIGIPWEIEPEPISGVGERAVWAGKLVSDDYGTQRSLAALSGDAYFQFTTIGPDRDAVAAFAARAVGKYAD